MSADPTPASSTPASPKKPRKPDWQRNIRRAGALATAGAAIATVVVGAGQAFQSASGLLRGGGAEATPVAVVDASGASAIRSGAPVLRSGAPGATPAAVVDTSGATVIRSGTPQADQFVTQLVAANGGGPLKLNHKLFGLRAAVSVTLEYACKPSGRCSTTRVAAPNDNASYVLDENGKEGMWYQGCWVVDMVGNGYGADKMDLGLTRQGTSCEDKAG